MANFTLTPPYKPTVKSKKARIFRWSEMVTCRLDVGAGWEQIRILSGHRQLFCKQGRYATSDPIQGPGIDFKAWQSLHYMKAWFPDGFPIFLSFFFLLATTLTHVTCVLHIVFQDPKTGWDKDWFLPQEWCDAKDVKKCHEHRESGSCLWVLRLSGLRHFQLSEHVPGLTTNRKCVGVRLVFGLSVLSLRFLQPNNVASVGLAGCWRWWAWFIAKSMAVQNADANATWLDRHATGVCKSSIWVSKEAESESSRFFFHPIGLSKYIL